MASGGRSFGRRPVVATIAALAGGTVAAITGGSAAPTTTPVEPIPLNEDAGSEWEMPADYLSPEARQFAEDLQAHSMVDWPQVDWFLNDHDAQVLLTNAYAAFDSNRALDPDYAVRGFDDAGNFVLTIGGIPITATGDSYLRIDYPVEGQVTASIGTIDEITVGPDMSSLDIVLLASRLKDLLAWDAVNGNSYLGQYWDYIEIELPAIVASDSPESVKEFLAAAATRPAIAQPPLEVSPQFSQYKSELESFDRGSRLAAAISSFDSTGIAEELANPVSGGRVQRPADEDVVVVRVGDFDLKLGALGGYNANEVYYFQVPGGADAVTMDDLDEALIEWKLELGLDLTHSGERLREFDQQPAAAFLRPVRGGLDLQIAAGVDLTNQGL